MTAKKGRSFYYMTLLVAVIGTAWLAGLLLFITSIHSFTEPPIDDNLPSTEAIIVLTGGSDRLSTGLDLLKAGKGQKLLVSGVYPGLSLDKILYGQPVAQNLRDCCIILGHTAADTIGNAEETRQWMLAQQFHSLRLVTANYHMPRSLLLFREVMPDLEIVPHPVAPENVKIDGWWMWPGTAMLLATEYDKFLLASVRAQLKALI